MQSVTEMAIMEPIVVDAVIDENHQLVVQLPGVELGRVKVTVERVENGVSDEPPQPMTREAVKAKLIAAGLVKPETHYAPEDAEEMSEEDEERLGRLLASDRPVEDYINEDREERF